VRSRHMPNVDLQEHDGTTIPLVDLNLQHAVIEDEILNGWARLVDESSFIQGPDVEHFERAFADFCGVRHCIGVGNGTDALELALRAAGVVQGEQAVVPANSFVASAAAIVRAGATPVLVDVDPKTYLMDPELTAASIGPRTRAIVPVHLYGQMAPMEDLAALADEDRVIVEDAAQAHGATQKGVPPGHLGAAAATSFYPGKNLGAYGDGGAVLTNSDELARNVRALGNHGSHTKYRHPRLGFNSRLDTMQAVVLQAKLRHLARWNGDRRAAAARYDVMLADLDEVVRPTVLPGNEHVWHLYVIQVERRDQVIAQLLEFGIHAGIHYPVPIHLQGAFRHLGYHPGDFPVAESAARRILSLPLYPGITIEQQERVVDAIGRAFR
jgi:dTDP-4-amino-4,6-dideoxygalactose transaminase